MSRLVDVIEEWHQAERARGRSSATIAYRRVYLAQFLAWLEARGVVEAQAITPSITVEYVAHLRARRTAYKRAKSTPLSPTTLASEISVLRSFGRWLAARSVVLFDPADHLDGGRSTKPLPRTVLSESEVERLLAAPGTDVLGLRDRAVLETLYSTGLRRAELCGLDLLDVDLAVGSVRVREGKGGKDRIVPIGEHALASIRAYLRESRPHLVQRSKQTALFVASITGRRLSVKTMNRLVRLHGQAAGIDRPVTPHVLRHTCATHLLRGGADLRYVQELLGHALISTTKVYTRVVVEDLVVVHRRHHPRDRMKVL